MTREEAIKWLKTFKGNTGMTELSQAFDVAIKALEQEPCEDAISRQAVMDCFKKWQPYMATRLWDFEQELSALQSVTSQPKTGHWQVVCDGYGDSAYICECSECKDTVWVYKDADRKWNYCPNCGAKMESEDDI